MAVKSNLMKVQMQMDKLGYGNYAVWAIQMRAVLTHQGLAAAIEAPKTDVEGNIITVNEETDARAKSLLVMHVSPHLLFTVDAAPTARQAWLKLEKLHRQKSVAKIALVKREMGKLKLGDSDPIEKLQTKLQMFEEELIADGAPPTQSEMLQTLVEALPERFDPYIALLEQQIDTSQIDIDEVFARLQIADTRMKTRRLKSGESDEAEANAVAANFGNGRSRKPQAQVNGQNGGVGENKEATGCYHCGKPGHKQKTCWVLHPEEASQTSGRQG